MQQYTTLITVCSLPEATRSTLIVCRIECKVNFTKWSSVACLVQQCATGDFVALSMLAM